MSSRWPDKYIIGLTGNIATGKSVVRKMLEHLGAFGIDADRLSHLAMAKGGPAYQPVVDTFGRFILAKNGEIDRARLGRLVFSDPSALAELEALVHPIVGQAVDVLVRRARQPVIVIEAIKLLEGNLHTYCDAIWVSDAPRTVQLERLTSKRKLARADALRRIEAQNDQQAKLARAHVVISNDGPFEDTWRKVQAAWRKLPIFDDGDARRSADAMQTVATVSAAESATSAQVEVRRGTPGDAAMIARFINDVSRPAKPLSRLNVIEAFGEQAYLYARSGKQVLALIGWQVENLVARIRELHVAPGIPAGVLTPLLHEVEQTAQDLQSEAALLFVTEPMARQAASVLSAAGYALADPESLSISAWREAARETQPPGTLLMLKKLRSDRVLRPL